MGLHAECLLSTVLSRSGVEQCILHVRRNWTVVYKALKLLISIPMRPTECQIPGATKAHPHSHAVESSLEDAGVRAKRSLRRIILQPAILLFLHLCNLKRQRHKTVCCCLRCWGSKHDPHSLEPFKTTHRVGGKSSATPRDKPCAPRRSSSGPPRCYDRTGTRSRGRQ